MRSLEEQRRFFASGATLPLEVRLRWLKALGREIRARQEEIAAALRADLGKSQAESYMTETGQCLAELRGGCAPAAPLGRRHPGPDAVCSLSREKPILREPLGVCLVIAPWNYPFLLAITPVISAIAAGNCVTLKPSEYAPATAKLIRKLCAACLPEEVCRVVTGDAAVGRRPHPGAVRSDLLHRRSCRRPQGYGCRCGASDAGGTGARRQKPLYRR